MGDGRAIIVRGGRVLDGARPGAEPGDLLIEGDTIRDVGPPGLAAPDDAIPVDARGKLLHPGLVNAHTHGYHAAHKATTDRWTLERFLTVSPWINADLSLEATRLSTRIAAVEMALKGCTACYDLPLPLPLPTLDALDSVARAYVDVGIRAVVAPMVADISVFHAVPGFLDALPPSLRRDLEDRAVEPEGAILSQYRTLFRDWRGEGGLVRLAVSPAIAHHCTASLFTGLAELARENGAGLHTHLAESRIQAVSGLKRFGKTVTAWLDGLGVLGPNFTAAHGVWLDDDDVRRLADSGAALAHNPGSNLRLGVGIADVRKMLDAGLDVGVGTDGARSSDHQNMYEATRLAALVSTAHGRGRDAGLSAAEVFHAATVGGARTLGLDKLGRLAPGYKADIVFLDLGRINWIPLNDPLLQIVHVEDGGSVDTVMVGGKTVVENGRPTTVDMAALAAEADRLRPRFEELMSRNPEPLGQVQAVGGEFCGALAAEPYHIERRVPAAADR